MASAARGPGTTFGGRYVLDRLVGAGSFGQVWAAHDQGAFGKLVAVKLLLEQHLTNAEVVSRFRREAKATAALQHPNVVSLLAFDNDEGMPYLVSEFVAGQPLRGLLDDRLESGRMLDIEYALAIFRRICAGVTAAHAAGIIHRDLKPENVMVDGEGETLAVKVLDFGIARMLEAHDSLNSERTETGRVMGSFRYMSPEQVLGDVQRVSVRSDVFSLAAVLFELLTLRRAFEGDAVHEVISKILTGPRPRAREVRPELPDAVDVVFEHAFAIDPNVRISTPQELLLSIERGLEPAPDAARMSRPRVSLGGSRRVSSQPQADVSDAWRMDGEAAPSVRPGAPARPSNSADGVEVASQRPGASSGRTWLIAGGVLLCGLAIGGYALRGTLTGANARAAAHVRDEAMARTATRGSYAPVIAADEWVHVTVPAGAFALGEDGPFGDFHFAQGAVAFDGHAFDLERHEVTFGEYERWAAGHPDRAFALPSWVSQDAAQRARLPVVAVSWSQAQAYCREAGGDLPTEEEWEVAARAPDGRLDPWGRATPPSVRGFRGVDGVLAAIGSNAGDVTPAGVLDLAGNAQEWTASPYRDSHGARGPWSEHAHAFRGLPLRDDPVPTLPHSGTYRNSGCEGDQCAAGDRTEREDVGFRCARAAR